MATPKSHAVVIVIIVLSFGITAPAYADDKPGHTVMPVPNAITAPAVPEAASEAIQTPFVATVRRMWTVIARRETGSAVLQKKRGQAGV